jgi:hypothetical protein
VTVSQPVEPSSAGLESWTGLPIRDVVAGVLSDRQPSGLVVVVTTLATVFSMRSLAEPRSC